MENHSDEAQPIPVEIVALERRSEDRQSVSQTPLPNHKNALIRSARPPGCKRPYLARSADGPVWKKCGRAKCCRQCRDLWGWKQASAISASVAVRVPTHFMTLRRVGVLSDTDFGKAAARFLRSLARRCEQGLEYLLVREWVKSVPHAHALLIVRRVTRKAVRSALVATGELFRCSCCPLRKNPVAAVRYVFKVTHRPERKAEIPPAGFRGRMFTASRGFLTRPLKELWREFRDTRLRLRSS
jgi:hypothetical protein